MKTVPLSRRFLSDLTAVAPKLPEQSASASFVEDLAMAFEIAQHSQSTSDEDICFLGEHLQEWRSRAQRQLHGLLARLPVDDPLLCPISLFRTMDYGRLETAHTRALAWLLDPRKEHGFGDKLLATLLARIEDIALPIEIQNVESERLIDGPRVFETTGRIDILAEGSWIGKGGKRIPWVLVIEAKIDAEEGEEQLSWYEDWLDAAAGNRQVLRVFLTPDGREPETGRQDWFPLKFQELVETFRSVFDELRDKPGSHFLRFYLAGVLRDVCGWPVPIRSDCADPYSVLSYLRHVQ